jgi:putative endonuclease
MKAYVYILKCSDGSYYTGTARNLDLRISQHMQGFGSRYTSSRMPVEPVYVYECDSYGEALTHERQIKGWSRRKKEAIIRGDYQSLVELSKNKQGKKIH